ncbi:50S ribosomal protein L3 [Staphylococcus kloosii]|jgi:large subunit ribosomal protein L3|uniref:Large ribosomal subunit protein uL3 n=1 Tax=Staphylococcus kloosii TaxID=29384 RepID=A0A151A1F3_9STAP|nr:50S ribosomal protein L3 [Staphylococcus kloosii]AVQ35509.1 50S ribosomal protein L3 [Staphylococcus kloosii]KYH13251.1 50S ribosomal protein L3 [Staphylococcus kloosii]MBF7021448.1 50S ribosomal protein L3 [Staphylococcus kloosii]MBF7024686.1 50S ribosomal protein L3 [Staphylococcus kloosii]MBF7030725.1 50S ribosomal protein L3 [Staphylococcus kloosii]
MTKGILGRKIGMTQVFGENGELIPVTVVEAGQNVVLQKKTEEVDGYNAIQVGFEDKKAYKKNSKTNKYASKPAEGHAKKADTAPKRFIREFRNVNVDEYEVGQEVSVDKFETGDIIDVTGVSKGKGFQGAIKRHGQARGPMAHGSHFHRAPGSVGMASDASRVFKGQKMPGRMGGNTVTVQNLEVVQVDADNNVILVKGNVPGPKKGLLEISTSIKKGNK